MPRMSEGRVPKYRLHKPSGLAVVTLAGRDHYLGPYKSPASRRAYRNLVAEWLQRDKQPIVRDRDALTMAEVVPRYWVHLNGRRTDEGELGHVKHLMCAVLADYRDTLASEFAPVQVRVVRQRMIDKNQWSRQYTNKQVDRLKRIWKWFANEQLVSVESFQRVVV